MVGTALATELLERVTVVIRSVRERTEEACRALILEQGVLPDSVFIVRESPFSQTLRVGSEIGLQQGRPWTLFVDADLLLRPGSIRRMMQVAENQPTRVCQVGGYCLDKLFGGVRIGGTHLYRTSLLESLIDSIPEEGLDIRPETRALHTMSARGFPSVTVPELVGLHAFEQNHKDVFRTCFVHAHKHLRLVDFFIPYWQSQGDVDADFRVALAGLEAGIEHVGAVRIDSEAPYFSDAWARLKRVEKPALDSSDWNLERVEGVIRAWEEPAAYWDYFPTGMISSNSGLLVRGTSALRTQISAKGVLRGAVAWLTVLLSVLRRKLS